MASKQQKAHPVLFELGQTSMLPRVPDLDAALVVAACKHIDRQLVQTVHWVAKAARERQFSCSQTQFPPHFSFLTCALASLPTSDCRACQTPESTCLRTPCRALRAQQDRQHMYAVSPRIHQLCPSPSASDPSSYSVRQAKRAALEPLLGGS